MKQQIGTWCDTAIYLWRYFLPFAIPRRCRFNLLQPFLSFFALTRFVCDVGGGRYTCPAANFQLFPCVLCKFATPRQNFDHRHTPCQARPIHCLPLAPWRFRLGRGIDLGHGKSLGGRFFPLAFPVRSRACFPWQTHGANGRACLGLFLFPSWVGVWPGKRTAYAAPLLLIFGCKGKTTAHHAVIRFFGCHGFACHPLMGQETMVRRCMMTGS